MREHFVRAAAAIAFAALGSGVSAAAEPKAIYDALRAARPDGPAVSVANLAIERDTLRFQFDSGTFQFLTAVDGCVPGAVFLGKGRFELRPASAIERRQLAFETGDKSLETLKDTFDELVLLSSDATASEIQSHSVPAAGPVAAAAPAYDRFLKKQKQELKHNLQIRLWEDLSSGADPSRGFFLASFDGKEYPPAVAVTDPSGLDWMFFAGFLGGENTAFDVLDDSKGGLWYCSASRARIESGKPAPTRVLARPLSYSVDTTIRKNEDIAGTTTIRFEPLVEKLQVLPVQLYPRVRLKEVSFSRADSEAWTPATFVQEDEKEDADAAVAFPEGLSRQPVRLRLTYEGKGILEENGEGIYIVRARQSWYPNLGTFRDPTPFDLTYRYPKDLQVVSVGTAVEEHVDGGTKIATWRQERPIRVAGFNYGKFRKVEKPDADSGMTMDIYASTAQGGNADVLEDAATADSFNAARVAVHYFGALPESHVSITQQAQASFGQSWPTLIYLPSSVAEDTPNRRSVLTRDLADFVDRVGAHEFAHQWWGHLVGWDSYRDQWLSEGFAEFTSALVVEQAGGPKKAGELWERTRQRILEKPIGAFVANDEAGPICQGWRLATWRSAYAAQAMIYSKGAFVLHMLRMQMRDWKGANPDEKFFEIMKDFATSYAGKNPSTRDFETVVERHMTPGLDAAGDGKADWFFHQWVEGTEIPRLQMKVTVAPAGPGQYHFTGSISQDGVTPEFRSSAHLYAEFGKGELGHLGVMPLVGNMTAPLDVTMKIPKEPKRALLNAQHEVLSRD